MLLNIFTIANSENFNKTYKEYYMILQQEKNKHYVTMIKHSRFSIIFNCVSMRVIFLKMRE